MYAFGATGTTDDTEARRAFELLTSGQQSVKVQSGIGCIGGMLAGAKAGPVGIVVGGLLGTLAGFWKSKSYRAGVYAQLDAMGLVRKRPQRYRDIWTAYNSEFVFARLPYAELTARVIVPLLQKSYPEMTNPELYDIGHASQRALIAFRADNPDVPISLAAETVLAYYGIIRNAAGEYDLFRPAVHGQPYQPPPGELPTMPRPLHAPADKKEKPNYMLYAAIGAVVLAVMIASR